MPKIQIITDGHPNNTTLIIDGVDITNEYEVGWIKMDAFSRDPEFIALPHFVLEYGIIESNPLSPSVIEKAVKKVVILPDQAGAMQQSSEQN